MMKKLLTTAFLAVSVAALAVPAHADDREIESDAMRCAENLSLLPVLQPASPLSLAAGALAAVPVCGAGTAVNQLHG
ncbi:hypothetical protein AQI95_10645 [Streptomyces yokosukanensis]|uniref:Chaplin domain-containing protein n=1 Tax=Streptomyces yokosukanensis TaxID=67386 RepID=A0A101P9M1_9ACTN|nr:hypothetical protein [Streptomyces yokosukanensis]KUN07475.1 hypothetical protein AQI95_10645 [Streptomyces yokosukanensis]